MRVWHDGGCMEQRNTTATALEWLLRVALGGLYLYHGVLAITVSEKLVTTVVNAGFSEPVAAAVLPLVGIADLLAGALTLVWPHRVVLAWVMLWPLAPALVSAYAGRPALAVAGYGVVVLAGALLVYLRR